VVDIDRLDAAGARAMAINNWGQVVGSLEYEIGRPRAFVWQNGKTRMLPALEEGGGSAAQAINELGQIIGWASSGVQEVPVIWTSRGIQRLPGAGILTAIDINNAGQVLGSRTLGKCVLWSDARSEPVELGSLGGDTCTPTALNDLGEIVGVTGVTASSSSGFIWRKGVFAAIAPPAPPAVPAESIVDLSDINNSGLAIGVAAWERHSLFVTWTRQTGTRVVGARTTALNEWGTIATTDQASDSHLLLADRSGRVVDRGSLGGFVDTVAINDRYQIAWTGYPDGITTARFCQLR